MVRDAVRNQISFELVSIARIDVNGKWVTAKILPDAWCGRNGYDFNPEDPAWYSFFCAIRKGYKRPGDIAVYVLESALDVAAQPDFNRDQWERVASYANNYLIP